jgi:hypothetical protein
LLTVADGKNARASYVRGALYLLALKLLMLGKRECRWRVAGGMEKLSASAVSGRSSHSDEHEFFLTTSSARQ